MKKMAVFAWGLAGINMVVRVESMVRFIESRPASIAEVSRQANNLILAFALMVFGIVAALIVSRQPRNAIGWLLFLPATIGLVDPERYILSFSAAPQHPPLWLYLALFYYGVGWLQLIFPLFYITLLFPTGQPPSPRWRWLVRFGIGMCVIFIGLVVSNRTFALTDLGLDWSIPNPIGFAPWNVYDESFSSIFTPLWGVGLLTMAILSVVSLFIRYRHAAAEERMQIKWLLFACALFTTAYVISIPVSNLNDVMWSNLAGAAWELSMIGFPIAIAMAILRYRLWDIDLIIRRTLAYALLTFLLGLVYFGGVALLQAVFALLAGQQSPLAVVLSTLLIAALFNPLRHRLQAVIDRRFFRRRYDTERILARFNRNLKNQVDGEALHSQLADIVSETLQPESLGLWMRGR